MVTIIISVITVLLIYVEIVLLLKVCENEVFHLS